MRVTTKGQVTIPLNIRKALGINPSTDVDFVQEGNRVFLVKKNAPGSDQRFRKLRGVATVKMRTDEIMDLTRTIE
jgi:AbrB family looped-hinge helix DNA binding protein